METLQENIISLELTKPTPINADENEDADENDEITSEPATPTNSEPTVITNKKKKRKRSKKVKH